MIFVDNKEKGVVALISVLIIGAVGVAIVISIISLGVGHSQVSFSVNQSKKAKGITEACAEEALFRVREDESFEGSYSIFFNEGECTYNIENTGGEERIITVEGEVGVVKRRLKVTIDEIKPRIIIGSWKEVE